MLLIVGGATDPCEWDRQLNSTQCRPWSSTYVSTFLYWYRFCRSLDIWNYVSSCRVQIWKCVSSSVVCNKCSRLALVVLAWNMIHSCTRLTQVEAYFIVKCALEHTIWIRHIQSADVTEHLWLNDTLSELSFIEASRTTATWPATSLGEGRTAFLYYNLGSTNS